MDPGQVYFSQHALKVRMACGAAGGDVHEARRGEGGPFSSCAGARRQWLGRIKAVNAREEGVARFARRAALRIARHAHTILVAKGRALVLEQPVRRLLEGPMLGGIGEAAEAADGIVNHDDSRGGVRRERALDLHVVERAAERERYRGAAHVGRHSRIGKEGGLANGNEVVPLKPPVERRREGSGVDRWMWGGVAAWKIARREASNIVKVATNGVWRPAATRRVDD